MNSNAKYLWYKSSKKSSHGLLDRRACLMIILAESNLANRIPVIPKFRLGAKHNHGNVLESYLILDYFNVERICDEYILEEDFHDIEKSLNPNNVLNISEEKFDYKNTNETLIIRHLKNDNFWSLKLYDAFSLAKSYHGVGTKFIVPEITPIKKVREIGSIIFYRLESPTIGLHLRRGDRLNKKLNESMREDIILDKLEGFNYNSAYYATNDQDYNMLDKRFFSSQDFQDVLGEIKDNYMLFAIEMYIVDNCDISVRTFNDSSPFYYIEDKTDKNYSICDYAMHGSDFRFKKIPDQLVKCNYKDPNVNDTKDFIKLPPLLPRVINFIQKKIGF